MQRNAKTKDVVAVSGIISHHLTGSLTMSRWSITVCVLISILVSGCATLTERDAPDVRIVGLEPLPSEGLELRFALEVRVQNPNETPIAFDGLAVKLDLDGRGVASGVSDATGEIPRFGEQVLTIPVSISAFSAVRQLLSRVGDARTATDSLSKPISYSLSGKLGGGPGMVSAMRFSSSGKLELFSSSAEKPVTDE